MYVPRLLTPEDVIDLFKVGRRWIERQVASGELRPIKPGGRLNRFSTTELMEFVRRHNGEEAAAQLVAILVAQAAEADK